MPPVRNARRTSCPIPSSEHAQIPKFPNELHSELMKTPNVEVLNVPLCSAPMSYLAANGVVRCAMGMPQRIGDCSEHVVLVAGA